MAWKIFDAIDKDGKSNIAAWIAKERIGKQQIAKLDQKISMLITAGPDLPPELLAGPIKSKKNPRTVPHVYKLKIRGDRMLRPMLCKGPINIGGEFTMLLGAIEVGGKLKTDAEDAEKIRLAIIGNVKLRKDHVPYG
jgi:hypothetical protein